MIYLEYTVNSVREVSPGYITETGEYVEPVLETVPVTRNFTCATQEESQTAAERIRAVYGVEPLYREIVDEPTTDEVLLDLAADHEYRLSLMELGLTDTDLGGQA
ncbi:hypothetical protein [Agathobaculum sp.]|uniref:hypothetical protein n=1 Tax=Agathobaculum sp. TaxID=2048138 RepID=UPI002A81CB25|nr:hypothetical protein [Agathobaculum sp.]MDY3619320.1 hypothetical protein [Agathobaculum sp.]